MAKVIKLKEAPNVVLIAVNAPLDNQPLTSPNPVTRAPKAQ